MSEYNEALLERNLYPEYRGQLDDVVDDAKGEVRVLRAELLNASCGDRLVIELATNEEGCIVEGRWSGQGCAIAQVSADVMVGELIGKTVAEAQELKAAFEKMIYRGGPGVGAMKMLASVARMPARGKCASLAWGAVDRLE